MALMDEHRVIYHEPICPDCGTFAVTQSEIRTADGFTETVYQCCRCGCIWPLACVVEYGSHAVTTGR